MKNLLKSGLLLALILFIPLSTVTFATDTTTSSDSNVEYMYVFGNDSDEYYTIPIEPSNSIASETKTTPSHPSPNGGAKEIAEDAGGNISPSSIIGPDDRMRVSNPASHPFSYVVLMHVVFEHKTSGALVQGPVTGFMVGPETILTAGHCVRQPNYNRKEVRVYVNYGANTYSGPYYTPSWYTLHENFVNHQDINYDYCIMDMEQNIGALTGWMGIGTGGTIDNMFVYVSGYPDEANKTYYQYWATGYMEGTSTYRFSHDVDTTSGQSGSPAYANGIAWGIHTRGTSLFYTRNSGCLITQPMFDRIVQKLEDGLIKYGY